MWSPPPPRDSPLRGQPGEMAADVAKTLYRDPQSLQSLTGLPAPVAERIEHTLTCRCLATHRAAALDRLAGDHALELLPAARTGHVGIGVHDPVHHLCVRPDVGCRDVRCRPDRVAQLMGEASNQPFDLGVGVVAGIDGHAALGTAIGETDQGTLERHPGGECLDLVEVDVGMEAQAALVRDPAGCCAECGSRGTAADVAGIQSDGEVDDDLLLRLGQDRPVLGIRDRSARRLAGTVGWRLREVNSRPGAFRIGASTLPFRGI